MATKEKKIYLEILRLIAIFMVLYVHTGDRARWYYTATDNLPSYYWGIIMACISVMCNYMFFAISGAVLLNKEESIKTIFIKRFIPMTLVFAIFSFIQYLLFYLKNPIIGFNLKSYIHVLYGNDAILQYWFFRAYMILLLILPFLRFLVRGMKKYHYFYLFGLYVLVEGVLPVFEFVSHFPPNKFEIPLFNQIIIYPILGYFVEHVCGDELQKKSNIFIVNIVGMVSLTLFAVETHILQQQYGRFEEIYGLSFLLVATFMVDVRWICTKVKFPQWLNKLLLFAGAGVFGVYLMEPQVRDATVFLYDFMEPYITWFGATIIWLLAAMVLGILFMNILKRIPVIKRIF